jgi:cyanophycinase
LNTILIDKTYWLYFDFYNKKKFEEPFDLVADISLVMMMMMTRKVCLTMISWSWLILVYYSNMAETVDSRIRTTASLGLIGDANDVNTSTIGGTLLAGGGPDVDQAFRWMIQKSGGGDFVVLRATGTAAYNDYIFGLGTVNSVETLLINSRTLANDRQVERILLNAEAVFITGGDQANYVNFWKDTLVHNALNYLRNIKKIPIGGTSAGCAILSGVYFSAVVGTVTSSEALRNPYVNTITLGYRDFLNQPFLENVVTDTHYDNRDRHGRLVTFLARMSRDQKIVARGIGLDESVAVCIEPNGTGRVYGSGTAYFINQNGASYTPETCLPGSRLDWYRSQRAVRIYRVRGSQNGTSHWNLDTWTTGVGGINMYYYVRTGTLYKTY